MPDSTGWNCSLPRARLPNACCGRGGPRGPGAAMSPAQRASRCSRRGLDRRLECGSRRREPPFAGRTACQAWRCAGAHVPRRPRPRLLAPPMQRTHRPGEAGAVLAALRSTFGGGVILSADLEPATAAQLVASGAADAVGFDRPAQALANRRRARSRSAREACRTQPSSRSRPAATQMSAVCVPSSNRVSTDSRTARDCDLRGVSRCIRARLVAQRSSQAAAWCCRASSIAFWNSASAACPAPWLASRSPLMRSNSGAHQAASPLSPRSSIVSSARPASIVQRLSRKCMRV